MRKVFARGAAAQHAVEPVGPAVVRADQRALVREARRLEPRAAVPAGVDEAMEPAVLRTHEHQRQARHIDGEGIARIGQRGRRAECQWVAAEDARHFEFMARRIEVTRHRADGGFAALAAAGFDQRKRAADQGNLFFLLHVGLSPCGVGVGPLCRTARAVAWFNWSTCFRDRIEQTRMAGNPLCR
jgi:hypothetical protein